MADKKSIQTLAQAIDLLDEQVPEPEYGLPDDLFYFISRSTPLINVDLLIKDEKGRTLLTWRDDGRYPPSWHVPGGIIRYKEKIVNRLTAVARLELGTTIHYQPAPVAVNEIILPDKRNRAHFISLLYECSLIEPPCAQRRHHAGEPQPGQWRWHDKCPDNLIEVHEIYRDFI